MAAMAIAVLWNAGAGADAQRPATVDVCRGWSMAISTRLIAREPSRLPLAPAARFTENGQRLELGDGLWHTVTGKGGYRLDIADVEAGQAVLMGTIREAGRARDTRRPIGNRRPEDPARWRRS